MLAVLLTGVCSSDLEITPPPLPGGVSLTALRDDPMAKAPDLPDAFTARYHEDCIDNQQQHRLI